jgi:predicted signal transduction protein with EAL and GGDEF domain
VERRLWISSEVDALTSLHHRRAFRSRIERLVRKARTKQTEPGLLLFDLDHFKLVYPVDSLKIDVGFVSGMVGHPSNLAIVKATATLGPLLGIDAIAEGVETGEQRAILLANGRHLGQGLLFAPARDASDTAALRRRTTLRGI